jgi:hypothetical protein
MSVNLGIWVFGGLGILEFGYSGVWVFGFFDFYFGKLAAEFEYWIPLFSDDIRVRVPVFYLFGAGPTVAKHSSLDFRQYWNIHKGIWEFG